MSAVSKGKGIFKLEDSDHYVGSLFSFDDVVEILHIADVKGFRIHLENNRLIDKEGLVDEANLYKNCVRSKLKPFMNPDYVHGNIDWDEYVICAIIRRTYPKAHIEQQVHIDETRKLVDIKLEIPSLSRTIFLEIDGITHFTPSYGKMPDDSRIRIKYIKHSTGCEAYSWPFWIQRCSHNLKVLLGQATGGFGALWTTKKFFSDFCFDNAADIIKDLNKPFDVERDGGIGYFYEKDSYGVNKPEHQIMNDIRKGNRTVDVLIPKGASLDDRNYWIPREFQ